ncbi:intercellular adhesion molecule 1 [Sarcophilus harrisii]|uniref:intercellular adhesion molecule 1 n=1 Tax=Sarcophilus harrisii TaxID=9305 RepID=UPI000226F157|nr:intercellular adhesion molecule 1 [Sarcophilus harrisii]
MRLLRPLPALAALLLLSLLSSSGDQVNLPQTQVWVDPPNPVILLGTKVIVNCSTDCADPLDIGLETRLARNVESSGTSWKAFSLSNVTQDNSPLCFVNCPGKRQGSARANIMVYELPRRLELSLEPSQEHSSPPIPVGQNIILTCRLAGGRPRQRLTVALLQGTQKISRQSAPESTLDTVVFEFPMTASRQDDDTSFSCHAELDLQARGLELYESSSAPLKLYTYDIAPEPPNLMASQVLEVRTKKQVSCDMHNLFPVERAQIQLSWGGQILTQNSTTRQGNLLKATATITAQEEGDRELTCRVTLENEIRQISENVTVYYLSEPTFTVSDPIEKGSLVNLTCHAKPPARAVIEGAPSNETDRLSLIVQEKDNGRLFTCSAVLELRGETVTKNRTLKINFSVQEEMDLTPILIGVLVSVVAVSLLSFVGYIYYRQRRIRSYELKKAQEARAMQLIKPEAKLCP